MSQEKINSRSSAVFPVLIGSLLQIGLIVHKLIFPDNEHQVLLPFFPKLKEERDCWYKVLTIESSM